MCRLLRDRFFSLAISVCIGIVIAEKTGQAQIISDETVNSLINTTDNLHFTITGGHHLTPNLFHSFNTFSVPTNGSVEFISPQNIQNIFSRVTGQSSSSIDGEIKVSGNTANLFLLNPNGILFGSNASLNLSGSFLATTAEAFQFDDGTLFSTTTTQANPLLTIHNLVGLQFSKIPGDIINQSSLRDSFNTPIGLQVPTNQTLVLVGGDIRLEGGFLSTSGGRIELGSVAGNTFVDVSFLDSGLALDYTQVNTFQDIQLSNEAVITTSGASSGAITLEARNILVDQSSEISAINFGTLAGEAITLNASDSVKLNNLSDINTLTIADGEAGDIVINTKQLLLEGESTIDANTQFFGNGNGGDILINATELLRLTDRSRLTAQTFGAGNAGDLNISTDSLILDSGSQIISMTQAEGNGGQIGINATDSILIQGSQLEPLIQALSRSGILASTDSLVPGQIATGNSGNISLTTPNLTIADNGLISVAATDTSTGNAGDLILTTTNTTLDNGTLSAQTSSGNGGNITLNANNLLTLRNTSEISATAGEGGRGGDGGNIDITADFLIADRDNNSITANAFTGTGGNIDINTRALFGSQFLTISASSELGLDGQVDLTEDLNVTQQLNPLPQTPRPAPELHQGCPVVGGEGSFKRSELALTLPEAQGLIAQADGTIALIKDPNKATITAILERGFSYEQSGQWAKASATYEAAISNGYETPELYQKLVNAFLQLEPTQNNLQTIIDTQSEIQLTELEDLLNCGDITLKSIYEVEPKADAIVNIIESSKTQELILIVSLPDTIGLPRHCCLKI